MRTSSILIVCVLGFTLPLLAVAADEPKLGWSDAGELGYVSTSGNAEVSTLGLKNTLKYTWTNALFQFNVAGVRSKTNVVTDRFFVRRSSGADLVEEKEDRVD